MTDALTATYVCINGDFSNVDEALAQAHLAANPTHDLMVVHAGDDDITGATDFIDNAAVIAPTLSDNNVWTGTNEFDSGIDVPDAFISATGANGQYTRVATATGNRAITSRTTADANYRYRMNADGSIQWGNGTAAADTFQARTGVAELTITGMLKVTGTPTDPTDVATVAFGNANWAGGGVQLSDNNVWTGTNEFDQGITLTNGQAVTWPDTAYSIYQPTSSRVGTDAVLYGGSGLAIEGLMTSTNGITLTDGYPIRNEYLSNSQTLLETYKQGDVEDRFYLLQTGESRWGDGANPQDTNLKRESADVLKTDDRFHAVDGVTTKTKAGTPTDGDFAQTPADGTMVADTTTSKLWIRFGGTWKSVALT